MKLWKEKEKCCESLAVVVVVAVVNITVREQDGHGELPVAGMQSSQSGNEGISMSCGKLFFLSFFFCNFS